MDHHKSLSPSKFPALAQCIHYESRQEDSASRERGTKIHEYMAKFLSGSGGSIPQEEIEYAAKGERLAKDTLELIPDLRGIEHRVSIWNYAEIPPEEVTFGTCDAWGYNGDYLALVDAKSGQQRDYTPQMATYALGLMEEQSKDVCDVHILYCDINHKECHTFTLRDAEKIVFDIISRVNAGIEPPRENANCNFCARRPICEVWTRPAEQALAMVEDRVFDLESLKTDPIRLGAFLTKWSKAEKLVEEAKLKDAAKAMLTADKDSVPGWRVSTVNGRVNYDEEEIEEVLNLIPQLGMDRAKTFVKVDQKAFEQVWEHYSKKPIPVVPTAHAGTYTKLIRKK